MIVKVKRFDTTLPLPAYQSSGAACADLYARVSVTIPSQTVGYVPLNVAIEVPAGYWVLVAARSSTHKTGLMPVHGIGIGDSDFKGDTDEYVFPFFNFTAEPVTVAKGQRIAQFMVLPVEQIDFEAVEHLGHADRGKFGSTGNR